MAEPFRAVPFSSFIDPGFWFQLMQKKLNDYQLDEQARECWGYFANSTAAGLACRHSVDYNALDCEQSAPVNCSTTHGSLRVVNTIESFKQIDKQALINAEGHKIWNDIVCGNVQKDPSLLSRFLLLCYLDIKRYHCTFWFGFPALSFLKNLCYSSPPAPLTAEFNTKEIASLNKQLTSFTRQNTVGYFVVAVTSSGSQRDFKIHSLSELQTLDSSASDSVILGFCDPSTSATAPGWPVRNLLAFCATNLKLSKILRVLAWRNRFSKEGQLCCDHSLIFSVTFDLSSQPLQDLPLPQVVGWEKNETGAFGPRFVDLSSSMNPEKLAENAVNLNLQLMRWRLVPELDLDAISATKCLLIGAGTLGSNIARLLMAWGIKQITFVDNSKVNYNNPVRQSLYTFEDCIVGTKRKAATAAENLRKIHPKISAAGYDLTIPMPGHIVSENESAGVEEAVNTLSQLIETHDVVFLLTDSRESRWLPTLLSTFHSKLALSVALNFDSFAIVRHGFGRAAAAKSAQASAGASIATGKNASAKASATPAVEGSQLGCYFCTDVVAPGNSMKDRALDQQCTVTRPGASYVASALAVELLASVLQHPLKGFAAAETADSLCGSSDPSGSCLSVVPHQIRGFLSRFDQLTPTVQRFSCCIACSDTVMHEYNVNRFSFLMKVFNEPAVLEKLTGLTELQHSADMSEVYELSDSDSVTSME